MISGLEPGAFNLNNEIRFSHPSFCPWQLYFFINIKLYSGFCSIGFIISGFLRRYIKLTIMKKTAMVMLFSATTFMMLPSCADSAQENANEATEERMEDLEDAADDADMPAVEEAADDAADRADDRE